MSVGEGGIVRERFMVSRNRVGNLPAEQKLVACIESKGRLLPTDGGLAAIFSRFTALFCSAVPLFFRLLLIPSRLA